LAKSYLFVNLTIMTESFQMSSFGSPGAGGGFLDGTFGESPASQRIKVMCKLQWVIPAIE
jgi:hypothetical protein